MALVQKAFSDIITFSRSSNATRVGPNGLIQYAPHNLLLYSQEFDNAAWTKANGGVAVLPVVTANAGVAPDGTVTADRIQLDCGNTGSTTNRSTVSRSGISVIAGSSYASSIYIKAFDANSVGKTVRLASDGVASTVYTLTADWIRVTWTGSASSTPTNFIVECRGAFTSQTADILVWGAQFAAGPLPLDYTPTTTAAVYGPRFDYDPVTLAPRGLLIEEQRTNLLVRSAEFDNASWGKAGAGAAAIPIVTANAAISPDGTMNADRVQFDCTDNTNNANRSSLTQAVTVVNATAYRGSLYIKAFDAGNVGKTIRITSDGVGTVVATLTANWTRVEFGGTSSFTNTNYVIECRGTFTTQTADVLIWGAQLEAGAFATSYIPTVASTVTRSADVASVNTLSPWFNATEGTMFAQFDSAASGTNTIAAFDDNTANENYRLRNVGTDPKFTVTDGGVDQCDINGGTIAANTVYNFAAAYKANDFAACIAGGTVQTDTSGTLPTVDRLRIGTSQAGNYLNGHVRRFAYYPRRLTNAEIQALTS